MVHTLRLDNYYPTPRKLVLGTNSSFGTESIKIERGAGWDGLNLTATWHISDEGMQEWKAYLAAQYAAGTPVQVCYKLAEPVPFTATGAQPMPALAGLNTVLTDADSATVTGRADPIKRIEDLEAAVASIN